MYPNQQGYPGQYPSAPFGSGYPMPPQQPFGGGGGMPMPQANMPQYPGFPGQAPQMPGYPPQPQQAPGYPPQQAPGGYPPQQAAGYPPQAAGYPPQQAAGYPPQQQFGAQPAAGYPPQQQFGAQPAYAPPPQMDGYGSPQMPQQQTFGAYGQMPPQQQAPIQQQYASQSYGSPQAQVKKGRPTVTPVANFNASNDAQILRKAMKGFGTDNDALINVLCRRTSDQRMEIVRTYKTAYGKDLLDEIRSETSGNFERILIALLTPTTELYCRELYEAMSGAGTDEDVLIEVMCTMSNYEIRSICGLYHRMFGQSLENQLRSDTSGSVKRLFTSLSVGGRDESMITDVNAARIDAQTLQQAGVGRWGTDESEFNRILCLRNYEQLKVIAQEYQKLTGSPLEKDIKREFSGDIEDALLAILRVATNRPEFFARRLHKSMAGIGTNDNQLIRLVVTRSEIDMVDVKDEFQRYYKKTLKSFIKGDTSGHYKHTLYALCGEDRS